MSREGRGFRLRIEKKFWNDETEGYRKNIDYNLANKFKIPILTFTIHLVPIQS